MLKVWNMVFSPNICNNIDPCDKGPDQGVPLLPAGVWARAYRGTDHPHLQQSQVKEGGGSTPAGVSGGVARQVKKENIEPWSDRFM